MEKEANYLFLLYLTGCPIEVKKKSTAKEEQQSLEIACK